MDEQTEKDEKKRKTPNDWEGKRLESLLDAGQKAVSRARNVFIAINLAGIILVGGLFNANLPWIRNTIHRFEKKVASSADVKVDEADNETLKVLRQVRQGDLGTVAVPLVGMKFSVWDLSIIGSVTMAVLAVWFRYVVRRENLVVHEIWKTAQENVEAGKMERAAYLYHSIAHYFVFLGTHEKDTVATQVPVAGTRNVVKLLEYMPAWIPLLAMIGDLISLFFRSSVNSIATKESLWHTMGYGERTEAVIRFVFATLLAFFCWTQCAQARRYHDDIIRIIDKFRNYVEDKGTNLNLFTG